MCNQIKIGPAREAFVRLRHVTGHWLKLARVLLCVAAMLAGGVARGGVLQRVPNTSLKMPAAPPTFGYASANAFGSLTFTNPVAMATPPGETNRIFILQKNGIISVITNLAAPTRTVFMNIQGKVSYTDSNSGGSGEQGLLGLAFHPGFKTNHFFYVFYTGQRTEGTSGLHDVLARYQTVSGNTNKGDPATETIIISQYDRDVNHNSGDIHFGPDGYLYVAVGDEGAEHDGRFNAQHIDENLFAGILRIDVDKKAGNLTPNASPTSSPTGNYKIPADNPFVGATTFDGSSVTPSHVRTEFWAVGLRNAFRFSFDPTTGYLWCGDVGQDQYEEIDFIKKGGNYGWAGWEGTNRPPSGVSQTGRPTPVNPLAPVATYAHGTGAKQGNCVIGGVVYRGQKLSQLFGHYIFADYVSGNVWEFKASTTNGTISMPNPIIADSSLHITAFGTDPRNGDVLFTVEKTTGTPNGATINHLVYNTSTNGAPVPVTLYDTGAFTNLLSLTGPQDVLQAAAGIVPYDINVPFWSDNAIKSRWFSVPRTNLDITFNPTNNFLFPTGTVWIKHFNLELTNGVASSAIRLETRLLVKNSSGLYGVTYRWGGSRTNATLVAEGGLDESFVIHDGGTLRTQVWHYPSRNECNICHTPEGGFGLGFRTEQLNRDFTFPGGTANQLSAYGAAGYFTSAVGDTSTLLALAHATNTSASLEFRARSFLMANCSQCHQPGGAAVQALWDACITTPITAAGIINGTLDDNLGDANNHVVTPASTAHSVLLGRASTRGAGGIQMPPLDSNLVDDQAVDMLTDWINSLTNGFWISLTPYARTITAGGANTTFTIRSLDDGVFSGSVSLSAAGLPSGMTATFSPTAINPPATSTLTVAADDTVASGTYTLTVTGTGGGKTDKDTLVVKVNNMGGGSLPAGWTDVDIGAVGVAGGASFGSGTFTVSGSGADIWTAADQFNYAYQTVTNDVTVTARVTGEQNTAAFAKAGVLIRATTATNSPEISVVLSPTNGVSMQCRAVAGNATVNMSGWVAGPVAPSWVRVVRSGNTFTGYSSADGANWTLLGTTNVTMSAAVKAGLAVTAHNNAVLNMATFDNVSFNAPTPDLEISATPSSQTVTAGGGVSYTANIAALNGFGGVVTLSSSGLPSGVSGSFSPATVTGAGASTFNVTTTAGATAGSYTLTLTGTSGSLADSTNVTLVVNASDDSLLYEAEDLTYATNGAAVLLQNDVAASGGQWVSFNADGANDYIEFTLPGVPSGIYDLNLLYKKHPSRGTLSLKVDGTSLGGSLDEYSASPAYVAQDFGNVTFIGNGSHVIRLTVTGKNASSDAFTLSADAFQLLYQGASTPVTNFSLTVTPASQTVPAGGGLDYTVNSAANNFSSPVTLNVTGLPSGASVSFNDNPITPPASSTMTISTATNTPTGTYTVTVTGSGGGLTNSDTTVLIVTPPATASTLYESELLDYTTNGAVVVLQNDAVASGGQWISFNATASSQYIEFTLTNVAADTYNLDMLYKEHPSRGILSLTVDGVKLGGNLDEYSATPLYVENDFGNITFTADGDHVIRLATVGKNAASGAFTLASDAFRLTSTNQAWLHQDIGAVGVAGSFSEADDTLTVAGSGSDIWTTADQFHYAYQDVSGDQTIIARVVSEQNPAPFAKAGVMIRASTDNNSVFASVVLAPTNGAAFICRMATGISAINQSGWVAGNVPPAWMKLVRSGNSFTGYTSPDGSAWTQIGVTNLTMNGGVTAGLAVTSHDNTRLNTAVFDNVSLPYDLSGLSVPLSLSPQLKLVKQVPLSLSPSLRNGIWRMSVNGPASGIYTVQASTNLVDWVTIFQTNASAMPVNWTDDHASNYPTRFYRVLVSP